MDRELGRLLVPAAAAAALLASARSAEAGAPGGARSAQACLDVLDAFGIDYERAEGRGLEIGVRIRGDIGGVSYEAYHGGPLVLDCSLAASLARAGRVLAEHGIDRAVYSSSYQRRTIHGTDTLSKHSFGLALDVHILSGEAPGELHVKDDYEQGLGSEKRCLGRPLTEGGEVLRDIHCRLEDSDLFELILSPDYDAHHYNHFHIEARPWSERDDAPRLLRLATS